MSSGIRLKSFTITELLVVLIVASLLFASVYYLFASVSKYTVAYQKRSEVRGDLFHYYAKIHSDFFQARRAQYQGKYVELNGSKSVLYQFKDEEIIRIEGRDKQVFKVQGLDFAFDFVKSNANNSNLISRLCIEFQHKEEDVDWCFSVDYDFQTLNFLN